MPRKAKRLELDWVESETMRRVGYDAEKRILQIEFASGDLYQYRKVPAKIHQQLMEAESKGAYFNLVIRDLYAFVKLD